MGRPTSSPNGSFGYNKEGQLTLASNSYGAYSLTYDDGGRVTLVTEPDSLTLNFGYDKAGNRTLVTDSLGGTELSTYDDANFLTSRMYQGQGQILGVQFTNNAEDWNTTLARYGNGTLVATGETGYDNVGQATTILNTHGTATVDQFLNAYNNGNVTSVIGTQNGSTTTLGLTYDEDNELTGAGTTSYTFDSNGNRTGSAGVTTGNELTSDATWSYTYDADGNLIQKSKGVGGTIITIGLGGGGGIGGGGLGGGETWTYGYNPQDQLTQVQHFTGPSATLALTVDYKYDAFGNRIETDSITGGTTTVTKDAYDGWDPGQPTPTGNENFNVWAQTNGSGTLTSRYLYSDRVDQQLGRIDVNAGTATVYWTLENYQNSVRDVIDNTGALKDSIQYDAFGNITSETDPTYRGSYAWTGRELDAETDLQYNRARWYDATTGRWMTRDPLGFDAGDSNLYRYVNNAPTDATDPSGCVWRVLGTGKGIRIGGEIAQLDQDAEPGVAPYTKVVRSGMQQLNKTFIAGTVGGSLNNCDALGSFLGRDNEPFAINNAVVPNFSLRVAVLPIMFEWEVYDDSDAKVQPPLFVQIREDQQSRYDKLNGGIWTKVEKKAGEDDAFNGIVTRMFALPNMKVNGHQVYRVIHFDAPGLSTYMQDFTVGKQQYQKSDKESRITFNYYLSTGLGQKVPGSDLTGGFAMYLSTDGQVDATIHGEGILGIAELSRKFPQGGMPAEPFQILPGRDWFRSPNPRIFDPWWIDPPLNPRF